MKIINQGNGNHDGAIGIVEAIVGPMGCGKTNELYRLLQIPPVRKRGVILCIPVEGNRTNGGNKPGKRVQPSRIGAKYTGPRCLFTDPNELLIKVQPRHMTVGFDEVQFADKDRKISRDFVRVFRLLRDRGHNIIWTGLQFDFRRQPFPVVGKLLAISTRIKTYDGDCEVCGVTPAPWAQRLQHGQPVPWGDPLFLPDTKENREAGYTYETRCTGCHVVERQITPALAEIRRLIEFEREHRMCTRKSRSGS